MDINKITSIANNLLEILNSLIQNKISNNNNFELKSIPQISLLNYIKRLLKYTPFSLECYIIAIIYLKRVSNLINPYSIHQIFLISLLIANKFYEDFYYSNVFFSRLGGIPVHKVTLFEIELLKHLQFNCMIDISEFNSYISLLNFS